MFQYSLCWTHISPKICIVYQFDQLINLYPTKFFLLEMYYRFCYICVSIHGITLYHLYNWLSSFSFIALFIYICILWIRSKFCCNDLILVLLLKICIRKFALKPSPGGIQSVILSSLGNGFEHKMEHTVRIYIFISLSFFCWKFLYWNNSPKLKLS